MTLCGHGLKVVRPDYVMGLKEVILPQVKKTQAPQEVGKQKVPSDRLTTGNSTLIIKTPACVRFRPEKVCAAASVPPF